MSVDFVFDGTAYAYPASADFSWAAASASGDGAVTLNAVASAAGVHGVAGTGAATLDFAESADGAYTTVAANGDGAATLDLSVDGEATHGIAGAGAATLALASDDVAEHGIAGDSTATLSFSAAGDGVHGIGGDAAATITFAPDADAVHARFEVRGQVQQGGVLINRRVRAYRRDTGEMVGEADTVVGRFAINVGFAAREHYVVPVDLSDAATDWQPPVANRVLSVLAQDA